jgi:phosphatidylglycerol---prolipoprotein diacylglyceryl transferase
MQLFSLLLGLGALMGLLLIVWRAPQKEPSRYLDAALGVLFGALIGSRAVTVAVNWAYYQAHPAEIFQVWLGGLSGIGALIGGVLATLLLAFWRKGQTSHMADTFMPLAGSIMITAWLGCWIDGCSYGFPSGAWWAFPSRDEWGVMAYRIPVQLIGAIGTLVIMVILDRAGKKITIPGMTASMGVFAFSSEIFILSFLRADPTLIWYGWHIEAWGAIGLMIFSSVTVVVLLAHRKLYRSRHPLGKHFDLGR